MTAVVPRGYSILELMHAKPIEQRPADGARCTRCGCVLARDHDDPLCSPCLLILDLPVAAKPYEVPDPITGDDIRRIATDCFGSLRGMARCVGIHYRTLHDCARGKTTVGSITRFRIERAIREREGVR